MASWHKRARIGVAIFGLAIATIVYFAMGERQQAAPAEPVTRSDPKAVFEMDSSILDRFIGEETNFKVTAERTVLYEDGSTKLVNPTIVVPKADNRTFTINAAEGVASKDQSQIELTGQVRLTDSDGFVLNSEAATFHRHESIARVPGAVTFGRGRMSGSGVGISYDTANNILTIAEQAQVSTTDEEGTPAMAFSAGSATLDRALHVLTLDGAVHALRGEEVIDTDRAVARLSAGDDVIQFLELRGNARVEGGGAGVDAMSARDIDLDYSDDGARLEAMALTGGAAAALTGESGTQQIVAESLRTTFAPDGSNSMVLEERAVITMIAENGREGRRIGGDRLELDVASDGALTRAVGRGNVRLDLPPAANAPVRTIRAASLDGKGAAGHGLTQATFSGDVVFTETANSQASTPNSQSPTPNSTRTARAQTLEAALASDAVTGATFIGDATFEEAGLKACAARLEYQPQKGALALRGAAGAVNPTIAEEQVTIEAQTIDVALESRRMAATGSVRTQMGRPARCMPATARPAAEQRAMRMPGLLDAETTATITAAALDYQSGAGTAAYSGRAVLTQGGTAIHADTITIDQASGDLTATGNAVSNIMIDGEASVGRAHEIKYVDKTRRITYAAPPAGFVRPAPAPSAAPAAGAAAARAPVIATEPELTAAIGNIRAGRIDIVLAPGESKAQEISARTNVRMTQPGRTVTGGATLTFTPDEEQYVVTGDGATPVKVVDRQGSTCREFSGRSLIFYKSDDRMVIDGQNRNRTQIAPGKCPAPR